MQSVILIILDLLLHSAGVGRTGTFIAVDAMIQRLKEKDDLDIYNFVTQMRTKRTFMVQNLVRSYRRTAIWVFSFGFLTTACGRGQNKAITYELQSVIQCVWYAQCTYPFQMYWKDRLYSVMYVVTYEWLEYFSNRLISCVDT